MNKLLKLLRGKRKDKKGFTLMEMLIVVAIIAILVAIAVPTFNASLNKAKQAADDANIRTAYTEYVLFKTGTDAVSKSATFSGKKITFSDDSTYDLQYYDTIDNYPTDMSSETISPKWKGKKNP